jgi:general secretion pathway protein J
MRDEMTSNEKQAGFTLIEILIAVAVFGLMATMAYSGLNSSINVSREAEQRAEQLHRLQMALTLIQRDITQISVQQSRDEFGDMQPPLLMDNKGERLLEFSRTGWRNPANQIRSTLQRVGYAYEEGKLYREYWAHFHRGPNEKPVRALLAEGIADITFEFLDPAMQWQQQWPPVNTTTNVMPIAVKVTIIPAGSDDEKTSMSRDDDKKFQRYFEVPVGG